MRLMRLAERPQDLNLTVPLYSIRMGRLIDEGKVEETMAALAKYYCTVKARNVCRLAVDVLGGNGVTLDFQRHAPPVRHGSPGHLRRNR